MTAIGLQKYSCYTKSTKKMTKAWAAIKAYPQKPETWGCEWKQNSIQLNARRIWAFWLLVHYHKNPNWPFNLRFYIAKHVRGILRVVKTTRRIPRTFCQIGEDFQRTKKRSCEYFRIYSYEESIAYQIFADFFLRQFCEDFYSYEEHSICPLVSLIFLLRPMLYTEDKFW